MEERYRAALDDMKQTIKEIQSLLAWHELEKSQSRTGFQTSFELGTSTEQDLKTRVGMFLKNYFELLESLGNRSDAPTREVKAQLLPIYDRFARLPVPKTL